MFRKSNSLTYLLRLVIPGLLVLTAGCAAAESTPAETGQRDPAPAAPSPSRRVQLQQINLAEGAGLAFQIPASWEPIAGGSTYQPEENPGVYLGVGELALAPPQELEPALFPSTQAPGDQAIIRDREEQYTPSGHQVFWYSLEIRSSDSGSSVGLETHAVLQSALDGKRRVIDLYLGAPSQEILEKHMAALETALATLEIPEGFSSP